MTIRKYHSTTRFLSISVKHGEYRADASKSEKRAIRRRAHSFVMKEGLLYLKSNTADMTEKQWIVNKEDQMKVILSCHDGKLGEFYSCRYAAAIRVLIIYFTILVSSLILVIFN